MSRSSLPPCANGAPSLRSLPMSFRHFLRTKKAVFLLLRRLVVAATVLSLLVGGFTAGRSYFSCDAMGTVSTSPCCAHSSRATDAELDAARCACCQRFTLPAGPAKAFRESLDLAAPLSFVVSARILSRPRQAIAQPTSIAERRRPARPRDRRARSLLQSYLI